MSKNKSMSYQVKNILGSIQCYGRSKHADKRPGNGYHPYGIYSVKTYETYVRQCTNFAKYCKSQYGCKTIADCKPHIRDYLDHYSAGKSASSIHTAKYAIQKLYDATDHGFRVDYSHARRERSNIFKNRSGIEKVSGFSESRHADLIQFGCATGLRRSEMMNLRAGDLHFSDGTVTVVNGKGGKYREAVILKSLPKDNVFVQRALNSDPSARIFSRSDIPCRTPEHQCRRIYAQALYKSLTRPEAAIPSKDLYICRKDKNGVIYDRTAMKIVSENLGHSRIDVIAINYL